MPHVPVSKLILEASALAAAALLHALELRAQADELEVLAGSIKNLSDHISSLDNDGIS